MQFNEKHKIGELFFSVVFTKLLRKQSTHLTGNLAPCGGFQENGRFFTFQVTLMQTYSLAKEFIRIITGSESGAKQGASSGNITGVGCGGPFTS